MFDFMKNRYEEIRGGEERVAIVQPEDQETKINYAHAMLLLFIYIAFISAIVYGGIHLKDCPAENMLPISMIVIGSLGLVIKIITCPYEWLEVLGRQVASKNSVLLFICVILTFLLVGWFCAMCYWSFKIDPDTKAEDHDKPNYCLSELYRNAYWGSIVGLTVMVLGFLGICGCACLAACVT